MRRSIWIPTLLIALLASAGAFTLLRGAFSTGLHVSPEFLEFGTLTVGEERRQLVIAINTGSRVEVVDHIRVPEGFGVSRGGFRLEPGESAEVMVTFQPRAASLVDGDLAFERDGRALHSVALSAEVQDPAVIEVNPVAVSFGDVGVGRSAEVALELGNPGGAELRVEALVAGKPFRAEPTQLVVPSGEKRTVSLVFAPGEAATYERLLSIRSNDPVRSSVAVRVAGRGVEGNPEPRIEVEPREVRFGDVSSCTGPTRWITVRNSGRDSLTLSSIRYPRGFLGPARSRRIGPGLQFSFPVSFAPRQAGPRSGELRIYSNDLEAGAVAVALSGDGVACSEDAIRQIASRRPRKPGSDRDPLGGEQDPGDGRGSFGLAGSAGLDPDGFAAAPRIGEGSLVKLLSYDAPISDLNVESFDFDPATGELRMQGVELPPVEAALDEYFTFEPFDLVGQVDSLGEFEVPGVLRVTDTYGNSFDLDGVYTTRTATAIAEFGPVSETGVPFGTGESPVIWFVGACPPSSTCFGQVGRIRLGLENVTISQNLE